MIKVDVNGKTRVIRPGQIQYRSDNTLKCCYKNHEISIDAQKTADFYVTITTPEGQEAFQSGVGGEFCPYHVQSIEDCLVLCINRIL